ncbi:MAG: hypothetical protein ACRD68_03810, partial [Pyrinomonadaceae bacterium]
LPAASTPPRPTWAGAGVVNKVFMFGTPNEGSAEAFATLIEGYSVTEGLRRRVRLLNKLSREDVVTIPSVYQLLPHRAAARFLDENLRPVEVDLYDPVAWRRYGWAAVNNPEYRARFARGKANGGDSPDPSGTLDELDAFFAAVLDRARRFHEALDAGGDNSAVALFAFGGDCEETLAAPVILRDEKRGRWVTLTGPREIRLTNGGRLSRKEVTRAMYEPGDGRVTRRSLLGEARDDANRRGISPYNTPLPLAYAAFACDLHSELPKNTTLQDNALTLLVSELMR